jgi:SAM-dependent methyltransferase
VARGGVDLDAFTRESLDRPAIRKFMARAAAATPAGARVLDAGAGLSPYRPLFAHCHYVTTDWESSPHTAEVDVRASLDALPIQDESFDVVLNTQVLEHVQNPATVLAELCRVLIRGGRLWLTAPLVWELHEEPFDYFRFTRHGLDYLVTRAGFIDVEIEPMTGSLATIGQLVRNVGSITGRGGTADSLAARALVHIAWRLGPLLAQFDRFDHRRGLPLGYTLTARRSQA